MSDGNCFFIYCKQVRHHRRTSDLKIYVQPGGNHISQTANMPPEMEKQLKEWMFKKKLYLCTLLSLKKIRHGKISTLSDKTSECDS